jgi:hypothetical protein
MVADSPIHNRTMLSLPQEANDQLPIAPLALNIIAPGTGTLQVTATASATAPRVPGPSPNRVKHSLQLLESESHSIRLIIRAKEQEDKVTPKTYEHHYNCYEAWWNAAEVAKVTQNPRLVALPAMPIIAAKVVMFLQYETTREKVYCSCSLPCHLLLIFNTEKAWIERDHRWVVCRKVPNLAGHLSPRVLSLEFPASSQRLP